MDEKFNKINLQMYDIFSGKKSKKNLVYNVSMFIFALS